VPRINRPFATAVAVTMAFVAVAAAVTSRAEASPTPPPDPADFLVVSTPSDIRASFDGVAGESADTKHPGWIDLISLDWGVARKGSGRKARAVPEDLTISYHYEKASPKLLEAVLKGKVFNKVSIDVSRVAGGGGTVYLTYHLENVVITSYSTDAAQSHPVDEVSLSFDKMRVVYTVLGASGRPAGTSEMSWDFTSS
jgi:type VI secretion system secreted protein Hcp